MTNRPILLVEDNPDDVSLTLRALKRNHVLNDVTLAHDGAGALEYLCNEGSAGYRDGANAFVRRPVNFTEFTDAINTLGMFWLLLNETVPEGG